MPSFIKRYLPLCALCLLLMLVGGRAELKGQIAFQPPDSLKKGLDPQLGTIQQERVGNAITFRLTKLPEIQGDTGLARYTYFWDFGDGHFAYADGIETVSHTYAQAGNYKATVEATAIYTTDPDDDPLASTRMRPDSAPSLEMNILGDASDAIRAQPKQKDSLSYATKLDLRGRSVGLKEVRQLVEKSPVTFVLGFSDSLIQHTTGQLVFEFDSAHFSLIRAWAYQQNSLGKMDTFPAKGSKVEFPLDSLRFDSGQRHVFVSLLADESLTAGETYPFSVVRLGGKGDTLDQQLRHSTVQKAHDPNWKRAEPSFLCPRDVKRNERLVEYTVIFQNKGGAYAQNITILDSLPDGLALARAEAVWVSFGGDTLFQERGSQEMRRFRKRIFPKQNVIEWRMEDVFLPGLKMKQQGGMRIPFVDTRGMLRYRIPLKPGAQLSGPLHSRAKIVFDEADTVATGLAVLRGLKGCCDLSVNPSNPPTLDLLAMAAEVLKRGEQQLYPGLVGVTIRGNGRQRTRWIRPGSPWDAGAFSYPAPRDAGMAASGSLEADTLSILVWDQPLRDAQSARLMQLWQSELPRQQLDFRICYETPAASTRNGFRQAFSLPTWGWGMLAAVGLGILLWSIWPKKTG